MRDLYLRAASEADLIAALPAFRADGAWRQAGVGFCLDVIGTIYGPTTYDADWNVVVPAAARPGFHANLRLWDEGLELEKDIPADLIVTPNPATRVRVWL